MRLLLSLARVLVPELFEPLRDLTEAFPLLSIYNSRFPDRVLILSRLEITRLLRSEISRLLLRVLDEAFTTLLGRAEERVLRSTAGLYILISLFRLLREEPGLLALVMRLTRTLLPVVRSISDLLGPPT